MEESVKKSYVYILWFDEYLYTTENVFNSKEITNKIDEINSNISTETTEIVLEKFTNLDLFDIDKLNNAVYAIVISSGKLKNEVINYFSNYDKVKYFFIFCFTTQKHLSALSNPKVFAVVNDVKILNEKLKEFFQCKHKAIFNSSMIKKVCIFDENNQLYPERDSEISNYFNKTFRIYRKSTKEELKDVNTIYTSYFEYYDSLRLEFDDENPDFLKALVIQSLKDVTIFPQIDYFSKITKHLGDNPYTINQLVKYLFQIFNEAPHLLRQCLNNALKGNCCEKLRKIKYVLYCITLNFNTVNYTLVQKPKFYLQFILGDLNFAKLMLPGDIFVSSGFEIGKDKDDSGKIYNTIIEIHIHHINQPLYLNYILGHGKKDEIIVAPFSTFEVVNVFDFNVKKKIILRLLPNNLLFNVINYPFRILKKLRLNQKDINTHIEMLIQRYKELFDITKLNIYSDCSNFDIYRKDIGILFYHIAEMQQYLGNIEDSHNTYLDANKIFESDRESKYSNFWIIINYQIARLLAKVQNTEESLQILNNSINKCHQEKDIGNFLYFLLCEEYGKISKQIKSRDKENDKEIEKIFLITLGQSICNFGENSDTTVNCYIAIAQYFISSIENDKTNNLDLVTLEKAESYFNKASKIAILLYGNKHIKVAYIDESLAQIYVKRKNYEKAKAYYILVRDFMSTFISEESEVAAKINKELANIFLHLKDYEEFNITIFKCLEVYEKMNNANQYNECKILLGDYYLLQNKIEEAVNCMEKVLSTNFNEIKAKIEYDEYQSFKEIYHIIEKNSELKSHNKSFFDNLKCLLNKC